MDLSTPISSVRVGGRSLKNPVVIGLAAAAAVAAFRFEVRVIPLLPGCAVIGVGLYLTGIVRA